MWRRLRSYRFRRTTIWLALCLAFLCGVGLAHTDRLIDSSWWLLLAVPAIFTLKRRTWWALLAVIMFGLSLGWWRGSQYMLKLADYQKLYGQKVTLVVTAEQDAAYNKYSQLAFTANDVVLAGGGQHLIGQISVSGFGLNAVFAGDRLLLSGKLQSTYGADQARMSYGQMTLLGHHNSVINELRRRFTAGVQSALPEPLASFGMGLLIGQKVNLPDSVYQSLLMVGLVHIIAVSGYNLTILLRSADKISGKRSKRLTTFLSLLLIGLFLLFAGTSASIVRAAIVSVLSIGAGYYGRRFKPLLLIALAAAITAFANPFYVWTNTSWYLSFLAFFGILVLAPLIKARWKSERLRNSLPLNVALESLCAELMTLPFVLHTFGQVSFIGLLANVLVVALTPLAMLLTLVAGLAGMLIPALVGWFAWPAVIVLNYMLDVAHLLSRIPHIFLQNLGFSWPEMIILYVVLAGVTALLWFKFKRRGGTITDMIGEKN